MGKQGVAKHKQVVQAFCVNSCFTKEGSHGVVAFDRGPGSPAIVDQQLPQLSVALQLLKTSQMEPCQQC